jgi:hypothetical protein
VTTIIYYAPRAVTTRFALSGEVFLIQTDHISSEDPAYSTRADSATPALLLTKLISPVVTRSASGLYLLFLIFPVRRSEVMPVLEGMPMLEA